jgi:trans-aconitate methyltransferase
MSEAIYQRPADYDLEHEGDDRDVAFYCQLVGRLQASRVIELGCGSGRVTLPVADAVMPGGRIVGVELNEEMLAQARRKVADAPAPTASRIVLEQGDMRTWQAPGPVDLVLIACSSITHLLTLDDQLAVWRRAYQHLRPGGRFAIDITLPNLGACAESLRTPPRALTEIDLDQTDDGTGTRLIRQRTHRFDLLSQRADIQFLYDRFEDGRHACRYVSDFAAHVYFPRELELLFRHTGFSLDATYGDYRFRAATGRSHDIVMVGTRP